MVLWAIHPVDLVPQLKDWYLSLIQVTVRTLNQKHKIEKVAVDNLKNKPNDPDLFEALTKKSQLISVKCHDKGKINRTHSFWGIW